MRGSGEAGSVSSLCEGLTVCVGSRGLRSPPGPQPASRPYSDSGPLGAPSRPGTSGARSLFRLKAADARWPAGVARVTGRRASAPALPDPGFGLTQNKDPEPPAASDSGDSLGLGWSGSNWSPEGGGGDLPVGDKQAINSGAKFPSVRPVDNRSRAHPQGQPRHLLPLPWHKALTPTFVHTHGCKDTRAACRHA